MSYINGVSTADISDIVGLGVNKGVPVSLTGVLWTAPFLTPIQPTSSYNVTGIPTIASWQLSSRTDIVKIDYNFQATFALSSTGVLYSQSSNTYSSSIGRPSGLTDSEYAELGQSLTNVAKFASVFGCCFAIKTDGTLWWCGAANNFITNSGSGQSSTTSSWGWLQYGNENDWIDIKGFTNYPYTFLAIKGTTGSQYLYAAGYNLYNRTAQGTTSGLVYDFARCKSDAVTDWSASISAIDIDGYVSMAVTESNELYVWGESTNGTLGTGSYSVDQNYPNQVDLDTDWQTPFAFGRCVYAIKTDGTLWGCSRYNTYYRVIGGAGTADSFFNKVGNDTDYEDLTAFGKFTTNLPQRALICAKKSGSWYVNSALRVGDWSQTTTEDLNTYAGLDTWYAYNTALQANPISVGITYLQPYGNSLNSSTNGEGIIVLTAAS